VDTPLLRRPRLRQLGSVLLWGVGVSVASLGALLVLFTVTQRFGLVNAVVAWGGGAGDFPWIGTVGTAAALPFVAIILAVWTRVAMGTRPRARL